MKIRTKKANIGVAILFFIYMASFNIPYILSMNSIVRRVYAIVRIIITVLLFFKLIIRHSKWNLADIVVIGFAITILFSALHAGLVGNERIPLRTYLMQGFSHIVLVLGNLFIAKIVISSDKEISISILKSIFYYFALYCLANLIIQMCGWQIHLPGDFDGLFALGNDNAISRYYLFAFIFACILNYTEGRRYDGKLIFVVLISVIEALYRQIATFTIVSILMTIIIVIYILFPNIFIWKLRMDRVLISIQIIYVTVMISVTTNNSFIKSFINEYLYGKFASFYFRFLVQMGGWKNWLHSPIFGSAGCLMGENWVNSWVYSFSMNFVNFCIWTGKVHSVFFETLYNYGIVSFFLFEGFLLYVMKVLNRKNMNLSLTGFGIIFLAIDGLMEPSAHNFYYVLPLVYYFAKTLPFKDMHTRLNHDGEEIRQKKFGQDDYSALYYNIYSER